MTTNYLAIRRHYLIWPLEGISTARINSENGDAITVLETDHPSPSPATKIGGGGGVAELADDPCSCFYLRRAARLVTRQYAETMKSTGLKSGQFSILASLSLKSTQSITELAERMGLERSSLSRTLCPLEKDGLINITEEQEKGRRFVEITKQGRATYKKALPLWNEAQSQYKN